MVFYLLGVFDFLIFVKPLKHNIKKEGKRINCLLDLREHEIVNDKQWLLNKR